MIPDKSLKLSSISSENENIDGCTENAPPAGRADSPRNISKFVSKSVSLRRPLEDLENKRSRSILDSSSDEEELFGITKQRRLVRPLKKQIDFSDDEFAEKADGFCGAGAQNHPLNSSHSKGYVNATEATTKVYHQNQSKRILSVPSILPLHGDHVDKIIIEQVTNKSGYKEKPCLSGSDAVFLNKKWMGDCAIGVAQNHCYKEHQSDCKLLRDAIRDQMRTGEPFSSQSREDIDRCISRHCDASNELWEKNFKKLEWRVKSLTDYCLYSIKNKPNVNAVLYNELSRGNSRLFSSTLVNRFKSLPKQYKIPHSIARYLKPYQLNGCRFLCSIFTGAMTLYSDEPRGGILADDMGTGKTIQVVAFLAGLFEKVGTEYDLEVMRLSRGYAPNLCRKSLDPVLLVVPLSVVDQWIQAFEKWGYFSVVHLGASREYNSDLLAGGISHGDLEVVIVGYERMTKLIDNENFIKIVWSLVIFDEIHKVKTPNSARSIAARKLRSRCKIGLTGTPMSNRLEEIWGIMSVVSPQTFGSRIRFQREFVRFLEQGQSAKTDSTSRRLQKDTRDKLNQILRRLVLRRTKNQVMSQYLMGKEDIMVLCRLTEKQEKAYLRLLSTSSCRDLLEIVSKRKESGISRSGVSQDSSKTPIRNNYFDCPLWRCLHRLYHCCDAESNEDNSVLRNGYLEVVNEEADCERDSNESTNEIRLSKHDSSEDESERECDSHVFRECKNCPQCVLLSVLTRLSCIANHLELVRADRPKSDTCIQRHIQAKQRRIAKMILGPGQRYDKTGVLTKLCSAEDCGKMKVLDQLLNRWERQQQKVLIFSNSLTLLDILVVFIRSKGHKVLRLDGSTPPAARASLCKMFNEKPDQFVFAISTTAGGEGLNITGASKVVIFDPHWNPTVDLQAQDRAYRIGQDKKVSVYRLVSQGTIEEIKYLRQVRKQQMSRVVLDRSVERRFFREKEFSGQLELLKYSRSSLTKAVSERWKKSRKKYVRMNMNPSTSSFCSFLNHSDRADIDANDDFSMFVMKNDLEKNTTSIDTENEALEAVRWGEMVGHSKEEVMYEQDESDESEPSPQHPLN